MLYICIPSFDEAPTVGVLLWRIRKVFQEYPREYEILVYDDASTDATREVLEPYAKALPLQVIGGKARVGYARAVEALMREASARTKYPRRDAVIVMQADFTDQPEGLPELVKRFEGGADVVATERTLPDATPPELRKLHRLAAWLPKLWPIRRGVSVAGVRDPFASLRLLRITVVRDLLRALDDQRRASTDAPVDVSAPAATWQANLDLLRRAVPHARRVESVALPVRFDVRQRATRRDPWPDTWALVRAGWAGRRHSAA